MEYKRHHILRDEAGTVLISYAGNRNRIWRTADSFEEARNVIDKARQHLQNIINES